MFLFGLFSSCESAWTPTVHKIHEFSIILKGDATIEDLHNLTENSFKMWLSSRIINILNAKYLTLFCNYAL